MLHYKNKDVVVILTYRVKKITKKTLEDRIKGRALTTLQYKILSSTANPHFQTGSQQFFTLKDLENQAVNDIKHAWGWCSRQTEEALAPSQFKTHI